MRGRVSWLLLATLGAAGAGVAHTRSESHSVWEINRANVDLNMTIPAVEVNRLGADSVAPSDEAVKTYLTQKIYAVSAGKRCALVPPVETLSATTGFRKYDFTFKCDSRKNLQIHSGAFFDLVPSHTNFVQLQIAATGEFTEQLITEERQTVEVTGGEWSRLKSARFFEFVRMGTMHIFTGVDHMSCLLGLVLISRRRAIWCSWSPDLPLAIA
jgi:hypothetical protein